MISLWHHSRLKNLSHSSVEVNHSTVAIVDMCLVWLVLVEQLVAFSF